MHPSVQQAATHPKAYFRAGNDLNVVHFLIIVNNGRGRSRTEPAFPCNVECRPDESGIAASVKCPLVDSWIDPVDCMENQEVIESNIPARFKVKPDWKKICESCPFRDY